MDYDVIFLRKFRKHLKGEICAVSYALMPDRIRHEMLLKITVRNHDGRGLVVLAQTDEDQQNKIDKWTFVRRYWIGEL